MKKNPIKTTTTASKRTVKNNSAGSSNVSTDSEKGYWVPGKPGRPPANRIAARMPIGFRLTAKDHAYVLTVGEGNFTRGIEKLIELHRPVDKVKLKE